MTEDNAREVLREFAVHRLAQSSTATAWKWADGIYLFPQAICAWCGEAMTSNRIWLVDERGKKLRGQVTLSDGRLIKEAVDHPHAMSGSICMGYATDAYQALFLAMSANTPGAHSHFKNTGSDWKQRWRDWNVKMFDHACDSDGTTVNMARLSASLKV